VVKKKILSEENIVDDKVATKVLLTKEKKLRTKKVKEAKEILPSSSPQVNEVHNEHKKETALEHEKKEVAHEHKKESVHEAKTIKENLIHQSEINIGMIGHVDHGKTSLTRAISGKWCDTHSEEMKRGISIRLGYADVTFYKLKTQNGIVYSNKPEYQGAKAEIISKRNVSFVDAPGHETLMTTMLSGAALMNGAVLVIAANESCPQPRTIEHLMALKFAGVDKVVVAQNKVDLITKEQALNNYKSIRTFLDSYGYTTAPIIPTAATFDVNIDSLIEAIETYIPTPHFDNSKPLKMFIARSFDINKPGTSPKDLKGAIVGGSITQGAVKVGDTIELNPGLKEKTLFKVMSISTSNGLVQEAFPGGLIALGTNLDPSVAQNDQLRGQIAAKPGTIPSPVKELKMNVTMFERMLEQNTKDQAKNNNSQRNETKDSSQKIIIKVTEPLVVTIGTNTTIGFVTKVDSKTVTMTLKNESITEKGERVAISKNINGQWRLIAYGEII
jgi:translation initiation factor 2 subunit 3